MIVIKNALGNYIRELRGKTSLRKAAEKIGVSHTYLRDLELGNKTDPSSIMLEKIAKGLNGNYNYLQYLAGYFKLPDIENNESLSEEEKYKRVMEFIEKIPYDDIFDDPFNPLGTDKVIKQISVPRFIRIVDYETGTLTEMMTTKEHLFDLYYLLQMEVDLSFNNQLLTSDNKKDILKFIENFIINK